MSWLSLTFVLAIATTSVYCGTVSKLMRDFRKPIKHLYLDFDETISTDALSKHVRNKYCERAGYPMDGGSSTSVRASASDKSLSMVGAGKCLTDSGKRPNDIVYRPGKKAKNEKECQRRCENDPKCQSVEYNYEPGSLGRSGKRWCNIFKTISTKVEEVKSKKKIGFFKVKKFESKCWSRGDYITTPNKGCDDASMYTYTGKSTCDGFPGITEQECIDKCTRNELPVGCSGLKTSYCAYAIHYKAGNGWCHLASSECKPQDKKGASLYKKKTAQSPAKECNTETMPLDKMAMVDALKSEKENGRPNVTVSMTGNGKDGYRKDDRIQAMANFISDVRTLLDGNVFIVSTSWYPVNEEQWQAYLKYISDETGLGFPLDHIFAVADPGPGLSADKGAVIRANMAKHGITFDEALFADDSAGNIKSTQGVCNTLHLSKRAGLDDTDRDYITHVASLPEFRSRRDKAVDRAMKRTLEQGEEKRRLNKHERKGKHNKAARGPPAPPSGR